MKRRLVASMVAMGLAIGVALLGGGTGASADPGYVGRSGPPKCCP